MGDKVKGVMMKRDNRVMRRDLRLEALKNDIDAVGYKILSYDPHGEEFPPNSVAARITGPCMPPNGLPFCVPKVDCEIWAQRICLVLTNAYKAGQQSTMTRGDVH